MMRSANQLRRNWKHSAPLILDLQWPKLLCRRLTSETCFGRGFGSLEFLPSGLECLVEPAVSHCVFRTNYFGPRYSTGSITTAKTHPKITTRK